MKTKRTHRTYPAELHDQAVRLMLNEGKSASQVSSDLGIPESTLASWLDRARSEPSGGLLSSSEHDELLRLRRENRTLKMERDFLKKAAAFFANVKK